MCGPQTDLQKTNKQRKSRDDEYSIPFIFLPIKYFQEDVLDLELLTVNKCTLKWIYEAWLPGECHISYTTLLS